MAKAAYTLDGVVEDRQLALQASPGGVGGIAQNQPMHLGHRTQKAAVRPYHVVLFQRLRHSSGRHVENGRGLRVGESDGWQARGNGWGGLGAATARGGREQRGGRARHGGLPPSSLSRWSRT